MTSRFVTPHGVEIEMDEVSARRVGYKPVKPKAKPVPKKVEKSDTDDE